MTTAERMKAIDKAYNDNVKVEIKALEEKNNRIERLIDQIESLFPRINELIAIGNYCAERGLIIKPVDRNPVPRLKYEAEGIDHDLGFLFDLELRRRYYRYRITGIGIRGGGCCKYNLKIENGKISVEGDVEYVLNRFVNEFDKFEQTFYAEVDNLNK